METDGITTQNQQKGPLLVGLVVDVDCFLSVWGGSVDLDEELGIGKKLEYFLLCFFFFFHPLCDGQSDRQREQCY